MTLDSTKGTSLGADEPASDSSKNDPSKMADAEKTLDALILSLKAKLVRSRKDVIKPSNSTKRERHILSEKYSLSRDRLRHRSRDAKLFGRMRSDGDDRSRDVSRHRSRDQWRGNDLSRGISRDTWCDVTMTKALSIGDISKSVSDQLNLTEKKVDFRHRIKLEQSIKVDEVVKTETPETLKPKQRKSEQIPVFLSRSERFSDLNSARKGSRNKDCFGSISKVQLPFVNKHQLEKVKFSPAGLKSNRQYPDVLTTESQLHGRRKKKRKFLKNICKDVDEIPKTREATEGSKLPSSVDKEAELIRLKTDRLRLDRFRGNLREYASSILRDQSRMRGLIRNLSNASPSKLLWQDDDVEAGQGPPGQTNCHGNKNCDGGDGNSCHGDDKDGSGCYGDDEDGSGCQGDDKQANGRHSDDRCESDDHNSGKSSDGDRTNDDGCYGDSDSENSGDDNDSNDSHGNAEDGNGDDDNSENGSARDDKDRINGDHGDGEDGCYGDDKDGNGCRGNDDEKDGRHGDATGGNDERREGKACGSDHGNAEDYSGTHGDEIRSMSEPVVDEFGMRDETRMLDETDTEAGLNKTESSLLTSQSDLSAPSLLPQALTPESMDPMKLNPDSPPVLKSIEELYGRMQEPDTVSPLSDQPYPATGWSESASIDHVQGESLLPMESEVSSKVGVVDVLCSESAEIDVGIRPLETNYSSRRGSREQLENQSSLVSKEQVENWPGPLSMEELERFSSLISKEQLENESSPVSKENLDSYSSPISKEQPANCSSLVSKEQLHRQVDPGQVHSSRPGSKEQIVNHPSPVSKEQLVNYSSLISKEQLVNYSSLISKEQIVNHPSPVSKEQLVNHPSLVSKEQLVNHPSLVSKEQLVNHPSLVSKEQLVNHSSLISKTNLRNQTDPGQIHRGPGLQSQLEQRQMCPEPIYSINDSRCHPPSQAEESVRLVSSISTGTLEKQEDRTGGSSLVGKPDLESIRARYAKSRSAFQQLTSLLTVRTKSKMMVDAKLERLRRELFRLKLDYFVEKTKLHEEKKFRMAKDCAGDGYLERTPVGDRYLERTRVGDGYLEKARDEWRLDSSNCLVNAPCRSTYSPSAGNKLPAATEDLTEEKMLKVLFSSDKDPSKYRSGLSPPETPYTDETAAVDLSTKVNGKSEATDLRSDRKWKQDVNRLDFEYPANTSNDTLTSAPRRSVRCSDGIAGLGLCESVRGESVANASPIDYGRRRSTDVRDDCSVRALNLASDDSQTSLCPKKRLREKYRDQTEQRWEDTADETTHVVTAGVHRLQETITDTRQTNFYEQQPPRGMPRPGRDFRASPPPHRALPASTSSSQKIAVVTANFREAETRVHSAQTDKLLTDTSEPVRKRRMVSASHYQPELSHPHRRSDYPTKDPDISGPSLLGIAKTNGPTAIQGNVGSYRFHLPGTLSVNRATHQSQRIQEFHAPLKQPQVEPSPFKPSKPFPEFSNSVPPPPELRRGVHPSGVPQWRTVDSRRPSGFGPEIAALTYQPGAYISPSGCVIPSYGFPNDPRDVTHPGYFARSSAVDRSRSGYLELQPSAPPEPLFFSRARPEDRSLLFSMGDTGQLLSSAGAVMGPSGIPGFYRVPSGAYYGNSVFSPEMYMANTKNGYELMQR